MTVRSAFEKADDVWYAADERDACLGANSVEPAGEAAFDCTARLIDAVAIDSRDLTRSSGYVEPAHVNVRWARKVKKTNKRK